MKVRRIRRSLAIWITLSCSALVSLNLSKARASDFTKRLVITKGLLNSNDVDNGVFIAGQDKPSFLQYWANGWSNFFSNWNNWNNWDNWHNFNNWNNFSNWSNY